MKITTLSKSATILLAVLIFSCGGGDSASNSAEKAEPIVETKPVEVTPPVVSEPIEETVQEEMIESKNSAKISGEEKVANSDCLSCHYMDKQIIGPAFLDIAAEYANNEENIALLANKVIKGGTGVWGETAMPPHASLSLEDAKDMVKYILSLKE
jgi:cytochrome c